MYGQDIEGYKAIAVTALDPKKWDHLDEINGVSVSIVSSLKKLFKHKKKLHLSRSTKVFALLHRVP